ncbi:tRNA (adenosine(37)-N6)-threonylcarbamoyltransferase complex ATPase subunit type 1 TsaE [Mycoplasmopsis verecunda]|uniref:tRNA threonylcarbamoyladenosine biosynthesis protein TsaE n=1 Tax=Mycoplasmopsis verecunda TaxID=171291 RepID=A0A1T4LHM9_9BACT|nr:tRNA (adenosine(37)-N6)-threonylcarbamoyltransferase complex ATPase subunit type 1 TsaE [Mycoplasmopsis verecunda]WPB54609.1 tRNA (adenosine(37)-N6)-threonylcarbamoyltransferase complex ATPase subunit type 1 TsaE [Mycoplasmopsis verecunda]SJZ54126.1 tRNA threonylcarbamoyladenosine biosynthesis protein TsaE [Mycoplasmopsis verecunda]
MMQKIICNNLQDLDKFITANLKLFQDKKILLLNGDLGAGKTTFVKLLAKQLGIKNNITSPSFSYMKDYSGLIHMDLYNYKGDIEEFEDYFDDNIVAIEWANLKKHQFDKYVEINAYIDRDLHHVFEITEVK